MRGDKNKEATGSGLGFGQIRWSLGHWQAPTYADPLREGYRGQEAPVGRQGLKAESWGNLGRVGPVEEEFQAWYS